MMYDLKKHSPRIIVIKCFVIISNGIIVTSGGSNCNVIVLEP